MLILIALALSILGVVLTFAAVTENPALLKFVLGMLALDAATALAAAWVRGRG